MFFWFLNRLQLYKEEFPQTMKEVKEEFEALEKKKSAPVNKKRKGTSKVKLQIFFFENGFNTFIE